jgi:integrase
MGLYRRPDSPFWWMSLERQGQRPLQRSTKIPVDGGTISQTKENKDLAQVVYSASMGDLARNRFKIPTERASISFRAYREWYATNVSAHKRGVERERSMLNQLGRFFDDRPLDQITKERALEWRTARREEVSASTINREQEVLVHLLGTAVPKHLETHPLRGLQRLRTKKHDVRILAHDEETRLLKQLDGEGKALIICALDTLARLSDVVNLRREQDHGSYISFMDPKVEAYKVPVSKRLRKALDGLPDRGPFYFASHHEGRRGRRPAQNSVIRMFTTACQAAEIPLGRKDGGISFHVLRHTGASRMLAAGVDVKTVMEVGGWKNLKAMERYLHPSDAQR